MKDDLFDLFPVDVTYQSEKAYKVTYAGESRWIPKSIAQIVRCNEYNEPVHIRIPEWFAKKEGYLDE